MPKKQVKEQAPIANVIPSTRKTGKINEQRSMEAYVQYRAGALNLSDVAKYAGSKAETDQSLSSIGGRIVEKIDQKLLTDAEIVDKISEIQAKILSTMQREDKLEGANYGTLAMSFGIMTDKKRLLNDQSTINQSFLVKFQDSEIDTSQETPKSEN